MKKIISLLLLLALSLSLFSCNGEFNELEETSKQSGTAVNPDAVGFQKVSQTDDSYTFRIIIDSENKEDYIDLERLFNCVISPSLFQNMTYNTTLYTADWFVDDKSAHADTKVFNGSIVLFKAKNTSNQPPENGDINTDIPSGDLTDDYDGSAVTITFYHTMSASTVPVLEDAIKRFCKQYPNITVEHQSLGDYDQLYKHISTEIIVNAQPNIAYCYPDHVAGYNLAKSVLPLDELIASTVEVTRADGSKETIGFTQDQINNFIEAFYNEGRQFGDDMMYTMPLYKSTEVLYYNKTFFDEHNLKVPTTWDEMEALCRQIKAMEPDSTPLGYDSESNWFITMCEQSGSGYTSATGENYLFDNETNWNFVNRFANWYAEGLVTTQELSGAYTSDLFKKAEGELGKSYMSIGSSAGARYQRPDKVGGEYPFEVGITTIPQLNPSNPKVISQGPSLCIFNKTSEKEVIASWLFVKFLITDVTFQRDLTLTTGYIPVIKSVQDNEIYQEFLAGANGGDNIQALAAQQCLDQANAYFTSPAFYGSSKAREEVGLLMQTCFAGYEAAPDKLAMIKDEFKKCLEECQY